MGDLSPTLFPTTPFMDRDAWLRTPARPVTSWGADLSESHDRPFKRGIDDDAIIIITTRLPTKSYFPKISPPNRSKKA